MNNKHTLWMLINLVIILTLLITACGSAAPEEPVVQAGNFECKVDESNNNVCILRENEDVIVIVPLQGDEDKYHLYAVDLLMSNLEELESDNDEFPDEFKPHRLVINFELALDPNIPEEHIDNFNPPIELGVRYTDDDVSTVDGVENLQLGFWDEENGHWVTFKRDDKKFNFREEDGYIWVTISNWGDRHIGFG